MRIVSGRIKVQANEMKKGEGRYEWKKCFI